MPNNPISSWISLLEAYDPDRELQVVWGFKQELNEYELWEIFLDEAARLLTARKMPATMFLIAVAAHEAGFASSRVPGTTRKVANVGAHVATPDGSRARDSGFSH